MITNEWAKQLAFDVWENEIDFTKLRTCIVDNVHIYRIPILGAASYHTEDYSMRYHDSYEEIKLESILDSLNKEVTRLGYGPRTNTLLIGPTRRLMDEAYP